MKKTLRKTWNAITWILVFCVAVLAVLLSGIRLAGLTPYVVLSGSMEPTYHVGSIIYVKKVPPENIEPGDPITFVLNEAMVAVTHRVTEVDSGNHRFITKGDANDAADGSPVPYENLIGKAVFSIPYLGYFSNWIASPPGMYIGICACIVLLILVLLPNLLESADTGNRKSSMNKQ